MPSTYSPLKIELPATGEQSGTWGNTTNTNLGTALEEAIVGSADVTFASGNVTLTLTDTNASQPARNLRLNLIGVTGGSTRTLTVPAIEKLYLVSNNCADAIVVGNATGATVTVPAGNNIFIYNDGTDVLNAITYITALNAATVAAGSVTTTQVDIVSQGDLRLQDTTGGQFVALQAPGTIATSYTLTLPVDDGTAGQALITDGNGVLSWSTEASGDVYGPASATDNAIARFDLTTGKIIQNSVVTIADTTGNMAGVGTLSSGAITTTGVLTVPAGTVSAPAITTTGDTNTGIFFPAADTIAFTEGGVEAMRIDSTGLVGIGTTAPNGLLTVFVEGVGNRGQGVYVGDYTSTSGTGSIPVVQSLGTRADSNTSFFGRFGAAVRKMDGVGISANDGLGVYAFGGQWGTSTSYTLANLLYAASVAGVAEGSFTSASAMPTALVFRTGSSGQALGAGNSAYGTDRMRITSAGVVLIGSSTAPSTTSSIPLVVQSPTGPTTTFYSDVAATRAATCGIRLSTYGSSYSGYGLTTNGNGVWTSSSSGSTTFITNGTGGVTVFGTFNNDPFENSSTTLTERMRIDSSGNVGIGTSSPVGKLDIISGTARMYFSNQSATAFITAVNTANSAYAPMAINGSEMILKTGDSERMRIDSSGDVLINTSATIPGAFSDTGKLQIAVNTGEAVQQNFSFTNTAAGPFLYLNKSRSGTIGTNTVVQNGDTLGGLVFAGADGTTYHRAAAITVFVDGTPGTNDMPGRLEFSTTPDGSAGPVERMRIDSSGNVGIGTSSAVSIAKFAVSNSATTDRGRIAIVTAGYLSSFTGTILEQGDTAAAGTSAGLSNANLGQLLFQNCSAGLIGANNGIPIVFATAATERMRIDSVGNIGIGTSSPTNFAGYTTVDAFNSGTGAVFLVRNSTKTGQFVVDTNGVRAGSRTNDFFALVTNDTERMRIDSSGNVGIGTSSPSSYNANAKLVVVSGSTAQTWVVGGSAAGAYTFFSNNAQTVTTNAFQIGQGWATGSDNIGFLNTNGANPLLFATNSSERMRITSTGVVLFGKSIANTLSLGFEYRPDDGIYSTLSASTNGGANTLVVYSTGANDFRFYVGMGGTVFATSTTISAISDVRLKENIQDIDVGLDAVMALKPRKFDWKEGKGKNTKGDRGWIAQEFETVFPEMIQEWKQPAPEGEEPYKSVGADLIPVLVKAIQEQQALITSLTARIAALESK